MPDQLQREGYNNFFAAQSACVCPPFWNEIFRTTASIPYGFCTISLQLPGIPLSPSIRRTRAVRYYASAADDGEHADASYCLGVMHYAMGDLQEAFRRYQTAAEGGNMLAWRNLASMYALGEGVPRSEQMAKSILQTFGERIERQEREEKGEEDQDKPR